MTQKDETKSCLIRNFELRLDKFMIERNFGREKNSLIYRRNLRGATQKLDPMLSIRPKERLDASAVIYPWSEVVVPEVDSIVDEMTDENPRLLEGVTAARSRQPIEFNSQKAADARWYIFQADSVSRVVDDLRHFLECWTMPLLDQYAAPDDIVAADDRNDGRILRDRAQMLRVVAASVVCEGPKAAQARMERLFGSIGLRRRYQRVFDYLAARAGSH